MAVGDIKMEAGGIKMVVGSIKLVSGPPKWWLGASKRQPPKKAQDGEFGGNSGVI